MAGAPGPNAYLLATLTLPGGAARGPYVWPESDFARVFVVSTPQSTDLSFGVQLAPSWGGSFVAVSSQRIIAQPYTALEFVVSPVRIEPDGSFALAVQASPASIPEPGPAGALLLGALVLRPRRG